MPDAAGHPCGYHARRNVLRDHAARTDDGNVANVHSRVQVAARANPDPAGNPHLPGKTATCRALGGMDRMVGRVDTHAPGPQHVVADMDAAGVEHDAVEIGVEVVANFLTRL